MIKKLNNFKYIFGILFICIIFFTIVSCTYSQDNKFPDQQIIEVFNDNIKQINSKYSYVGINWYGPNHFNKKIISTPSLNDELVKSIKDLGVNILRYPGGNHIYTKFWDLPYEEIYKAQEPYLKEMGYSKNFKQGFHLTLAEFLDFCKNGEFKATIQLNTNNYFDKSQNKIIRLKSYKLNQNGEINWDSGTVNWDLVSKAAKYAAEEVKWVKSNNYYDVVAYWELGNEEYFRKQMRAGFTGSEYARVAAIFIEELKKVDPNIKIILTASHVTKDSKYGGDKYGSIRYMYKWNTDLLSSVELSKFKENIYAVSSHVYPAYSYRPLDNYTNFSHSIFDNPNLDTSTAMDDYKILLNKYGYNNSSIFVNEFNVTLPRGCPYSHSWLSALGNAKIIMSCAGNPNCQHMDYHDLINFYEGANDIYNNEGYGVFHYAEDFSLPFIKYPVANVIALLNENIQGSILKTNFDKKNIYVISSNNMNKISVVILNLSKEKNIRIKFTGFQSIKYMSNKSIGINIEQNFTVMDTGDSIANPSEVRIINTLDNAINVKNYEGVFSINLPPNTISVYNFRK